MALTAEEKQRLQRLAEEALSRRPATRAEYEDWRAKGWQGPLTEEEIGAFYGDQLPADLLRPADAYETILNSLGGEK